MTVLNTSIGAHSGPKHTRDYRRTFNNKLRKRCTIIQHDRKKITPSVCVYIQHCPSTAVSPFDTSACFLYQQHANKSHDHSVCKTLKKEKKKKHAERSSFLSATSAFDHPKVTLCP